MQGAYTVWDQYIDNIRKPIWKRIRNTWKYLMSFYCCSCRTYIFCNLVLLILLALVYKHKIGEVEFTEPASVRQHCAVQEYQGQLFNYNVHSAHILCKLIVHLVLICLILDYNYFSWFIWKNNIVVKKFVRYFKTY